MLASANNISEKCRVRRAALVLAIVENLLRPAGIAPAVTVVVGGTAAAPRCTISVYQATNRRREQDDIADRYHICPPCTKAGAAIRTGQRDGAAPPPVASPRDQVRLRSRRGVAGPTPVA